MNRLRRAAMNSFAGLRYALRNEESFRQEVLLFGFGLVLGFFIAPNAGWYVAMIGTVLIVLIVELLNTAIERLADHISPEFHPRIGAVKDAASAAVFCAFALAGLVWIAAAGVRVGLL
ncbi:MAG: diacylglycerol kinase [Salinarimonadaceae bacterium]|nr:MAG: diacylglycerol kinase [Salinarimonadaceae bacterium]